MMPDLGLMLGALGLGGLVVLAGATLGAALGAALWLAGAAWRARQAARRGEQARVEGVRSFTGRRG